MSGAGGTASPPPPLLRQKQGPRTLRAKGEAATTIATPLSRCSQATASTASGRGQETPRTSPPRPPGPPSRPPGSTCTPPTWDRQCSRRGRRSRGRAWDQVSDVHQPLGSSLVNMAFVGRVFLKLLRLGSSGFSCKLGKWAALAIVSGAGVARFAPLPKSSCAPWSAEWAGQVLVTAAPSLCQAADEDECMAETASQQLLFELCAMLLRAEKYVSFECFGFVAAAMLTSCL